MSSTDITCPICYDAVHKSLSVPLCSANHHLCVDCAWACCRSALGDGLVPACPHEKQAGCGTVSQEVACLALTRWLGEAPSPEEAERRRAELEPVWQLKGSAARGFTSGKLEGVYLSAERARQGAVQCIGKNCEAWYVPPTPHSSEPQRLACKQRVCGAVFCSACRTPWHQRSSCAEALRLHARWCRFLQEELQAFLMAAVRVDGERWAPVLEVYASRRGALDDATRAALSRFDELRKMELWKEKHCKRCPRCRAVVEKLSGCDMMTCGSDNHGFTSTGGEGYGKRCLSRGRYRGRGCKARERGRKTPAAKRSSQLRPCKTSGRLLTSWEPQRRERPARAQQLRWR